ncbi:alpha-L-glutamate ligase [Kitasatospora sp. CM 4170]|uniref:RimK family alpha-L-glutamate ligase n=1 Tax=Kitasatospora aburaviensis TaxID=67265 RepID=A0ABW1EYU7_9ACTN|nr:alpha-L-glutamate ligase [Kitasatospora sp. CM 4170]WNM49645.1 alpha-L-glutamate ligase [Kitasatospora sp. CM 4170]
MTDQGETEGSRAALAKAVHRLTGSEPICLDARDFTPSGPGRAEIVADRLVLEADGVRVVNPAAVVVYEIPPAGRPALEPLQDVLARSGVPCLGTGAGAWRTASDKEAMVKAFAAAGVAQMPSLCLPPDAGEAAALDAFTELGGDVWARPVSGMGGQDVFHVTDEALLRQAARRYAAEGQRWLLTSDARNFNPDGLRHQYRVVVLQGRVIWVAEHIQPDSDAPCNVAQGATSTPLAPDALPGHLHELAAAAAEAVGLPYAGLDLAAESGGVVFEINVHPAFGAPGALEGLAVPYVQAHLDQTAAASAA